MLGLNQIQTSALGLQGPAPRDGNRPDLIGSDLLLPRTLVTEVVQRLFVHSSEGHAVVGARDDMTEPFLLDLIAHAFCTLLLSPFLGCFTLDTL